MSEKAPEGGKIITPVTVMKKTIDFNVGMSGEINQKSVNKQNEKHTISNRTFKISKFLKM